MPNYGPNRDEHFDDDNFDTSHPRIKKALDMIQEGEMNHGISRIERCSIIAQANSILGQGEEDYRD